jgi:hypothetical protein
VVKRLMRTPGVLPADGAPWFEVYATVPAAAA